MPKSRKDTKGRVLRKGETQRSCDGKYVYTYTDQEGKRHSIYSKDIMTLREREEKLLRDQLDGLDTYLAHTATLNYMFDRYISTKSDLKRTTLLNYQYMYDHYVRHGFGRKKIGVIKYSDVLQFYQYLLRDKEVKFDTLIIIHKILHPTFQLAVWDDIIRKNPSDGAMARIKKPFGEKRKKRHALTLEQQRAFINYMENHFRFYHWAPLFKVLLGTGCRIGEVIGLRWEDVSFDKRMISINHSLVYYYDKESKEHPGWTFSISSPKTEAGIRNIPMMDIVYEALQQELADQKENGFNETVIDGMKGFIFMNRFGNVHNPQTVNRAIQRICKAYNIEEMANASQQHREPVLLPHFSCHHLRHTFCSRFCENETNLKVIQSIMGHSDIKTTMDIYAEVADTKKQEAIQNLAEKLNIF